MGIIGKISRSIKDPKKAISRNITRVDDFAGKKVFGNTVGLKKNLAGSMSIQKIDESLKETNPKAYELAKNQFLLMNKIYDDTLIQKIKSKYDLLMDSKENSVIVNEYHGQVFSKHIREPAKTFPELEELLINNVTDIIKGYYGKNFQIKQIVCYRNYHIPPEISAETEMYADHWHCDRKNTSEMKLFVCMTDISEKDGPFHVQSVERTKYLMNKGFGTRDNYDLPPEVLEDPKYVKKAIGPIGSAYFGNANLCLHRAGIPDPGCIRDIVAFVFVPSDEPLKKDWKEHVEYTLSEYEKKL